jgi:hypothetical protein
VRDSKSCFKPILFDAMLPHLYEWRIRASDHDRDVLLKRHFATTKTRP